MASEGELEVGRFAIVAARGEGDAAPEGERVVEELGFWAFAGEVDSEILKATFGEAGEAAREAQGAVQVFDVGAVAPGLRGGGRFGMPEMIGVGPPGDGGDADAASDETH